MVDPFVICTGKRHELSLILHVFPALFFKELIFSLIYILTTLSKVRWLDLSGLSDYLLFFCTGSIFFSCYRCIAQLDVI